MRMILVNWHDQHWLEVHVLQVHILHASQYREMLTILGNAHSIWKILTTMVTALGNVHNLQECSLATQA